MLLQLNCINLPLSKAGPGAEVLVWAGELSPMEREFPDERVERVRPKSGAAGGTGVGHLYGTSRR